METSPRGTLREKLLHEPITTVPEDLKYLDAIHISVKGILEGKKVSDDDVGFHRLFVGHDTSCLADFEDSVRHRFTFIELHEIIRQTYKTNSQHFSISYADEENVEKCIV